MAYAALSYPAGNLADHLRPSTVYAIGLGFFALGYLGLALAPGLPLAIAVLVLCGGFNACADGVGRTWISNLAPGAAQGTAQGLYQGATGIGVLLAGVRAGLSWGLRGRCPPGGVPLRARTVRVCHTKPTGSTCPGLDEPSLARVHGVR
ncbi:MFS transporter [Sinomonas sp. P47F7]|uniref:MFS transporter n=1 Tax=Sinomonas sp. P47F7 TaxID=3410987 RepID=UPI003BF59C42